MASTSEPTLYAVLGVAEDADPSEIRQAYKRKSRLTHPDVAGEELGSLFLMVQHAYQVLSDEQRRAVYDQELHGVSTGGSTAVPDPVDNDEASEPEWEPQDEPLEDGSSVPTSLYDGPLPVEVHDLGAMPWMQDESLEAGSVRIAHAGLRRWQMALGLIALCALTVVFGNPYGELLVITIGTVVFSALMALRRYVTWRPVAALLLVWTVSSAMYLLTESAPPWRLCAELATNVGIIAFCNLLFVRERRRIPLREARDFFSWNAPGANLSAGTPFDLRNQLDGVEGEVLTAAEIGWFLGRIPGVRLVNSLEFPGSSSADVDHAVICGNKVAFIDSKAWKPARYTLMNSARAIRVEFGEGAWDYFPSHMTGAVEEYEHILRRRWSSSYEVRGYIVVHPKHSSHPLELQSDEGACVLVDSQRLILELGHWFSEERDQARTVDVRLLNALYRRTRLA